MDHDRAFGGGQPGFSQGIALALKTSVKVLDLSGREVVMNYQKITIVEALGLISDHRADKIIDMSEAILRLHHDGSILLDSGAKLYTEIGFASQARRSFDSYDKYMRRYVIG